MSDDRKSFCAMLVSPLLVGAVIVSGLASLSARNLDSGAVMEHAQFDHAAAVHTLLFRH
ncbi:MAG: hypothetical protein ACREFL_17365 [Stellaceae bacterium]